MNCTASDEGINKPDSAVHRFDRVHGFEVSERERGLLAADPRLAEAALHMRNRSRMQSHPEVDYRWSLFERYCMEFYPDIPFTKWLHECARLSADDTPDALLTAEDHEAIAA